MSYGNSICILGDFRYYCISHLLRSISIRHLASIERSSLSRYALGSRFSSSFLELIIPTEDASMCCGKRHKCLRTVPEQYAGDREPMELYVHVNTVVIEVSQRELRE